MAITKGQLGLETWNCLWRYSRNTPVKKQKMNLFISFPHGFRNNFSNACGVYVMTEKVQKNSPSYCVTLAWVIKLRVGLSRVWNKLFKVSNCSLTVICYCCTDVSCLQVDICDIHATCTYNEAKGKAICICNPGYQGDGILCTPTGIYIYPIHFVTNWVGEPGSQKVKGPWVLTLKIMSSLFF